LQKIEAYLADMKLPWSYADTIARQQTGIERVAWLRKQEDLRGVIAALHVEQGKRGLLETLDERLAALGMTREGLAEQRTLRVGWMRHRPTLRRLIADLAGEAH
ncbi:regulatory protein GemA, partial [Achromobacter pulmonis]